MNEALKILKRGEILGFAPEGTVSQSGMLQGKKGAAYLSINTDVSILPVALINTEQIVENAKRLRQTTVEIRIGRPFKLPPLGSSSERESRAAKYLFYHDSYCCDDASSISRPLCEQSSPQCSPDW